MDLRKQYNLTQEELSEKLEVSRQAISKWETGETLPELEKLLSMSQMFRVSVDYLLKGKTYCVSGIAAPEDPLDIRDFLCRAKKNTYAAYGAEVPSCRTGSHDLEFREDDLKYYDSYFGGEIFHGGEVVWKDDVPLWSMNYSGRVTGEEFSGDFLKAALMKVEQENPYRGPQMFKEGDFIYICRTKGDFSWFQGEEEIFFGSDKVYECYFHGGYIK